MSKETKAEAALAESDEFVKMALFNKNTGELQTLVVHRRSVHEHKQLGWFVVTSEVVA